MSDHNKTGLQVTLQARFKSWQPDHGVAMESVVSVFLVAS